jgi:hypothetical protein
MDTAAKIMAIAAVLIGVISFLKIGFSGTLPFNQMATPIAILVAGGLIAFAIATGRNRP